MQTKPLTVGFSALGALIAAALGLANLSAASSSPDAICKKAGAEVARFGAPQWLSTFEPAPGTSPHKRGDFLLAEARFPNAFGAMQRVYVMCMFDKQDNKALLVEARPY